LSGFRSRELGDKTGSNAGGRANHLVLDDTQGKIQAQLSSDHALSQLNLGSITRIPGNGGRQDPRGEGFELRTDGHGVVRAAQGMLITTEGRLEAQGHVKAMGETVQRLTQARDLHETLAELAQQHAAQDPHSDQSDQNNQSEVTQALKAQNEAIRGSAKSRDNTFPELTEPHLTLASPTGIQTTTAGSTHFASGDHLALTTGGHLAIAADKSLFASIKAGCSIFVHRLGIKLVAASGKVRIEAQDDKIELVAKRVIDIMSTTGWINLTAKQGIRLSGGGSELEISPNGIIGHTGGVFLVHAAEHATDGPISRPVPLPNFPKQISSNCMKSAAHARAGLVARP
jgi:type VI secretion system secreted protein VgrG